MEKFKPVAWHLPRPSSRYKGSYPLHYEVKIKRFLGMDDVGHKILHAFSGASKTGIKVDIQSGEHKPDIMADVHKLPFADDSFDYVLADPPYNNDYAERLYGTPKLKPSVYVRELVRVLKKGGILVLYHINLQPRPDGCHYRGVITIVTRVQHTARIVTIYEKE